MKKFILMLAVLFAAVFSVNAQVATENAKLLDNTYVGIEVGANTPLNFNSIFPLNAVAGLKFGKEFTPIFALEAEGTVGFGDNFYRYGINGSMLIPIDGAMNVHKNGSVNTFVKTTNVGLNSIINWSNLIAGYQGAPRKFEVKSNVGLGWLHYFGDFTTNIVGGYVPVSKQNAFTAKTGLDFTFNLGREKAHSLVLTPAIYWNLSEEGAIKFNKNYAQFGIMLGYVYHFKTSNGTRHFKTYDVGAMINEIDRLNDELAKKPNEVVVEKIVEVKVPAAVEEHATGFGVKETVFFAYDSAELDDRAKEALNSLGENGVYCVDAYASSEGTTEYNKELSQCRADAVKAYLESRGAKVDSAVGHGVLFGITTGRVAVVTLK